MQLFKKMSAAKAQVAPSEIQKIILSKFADVLKPLGFKRDASTFIREHGELFQIVSLQAGRWNSSEQAEYYINLSVYYPPAYEILWGDPAPNHPKEYDGQLRAMVHGKHGRDAWKFTYKTNLEEQADAMAEALVRYGLPYFVGIDTPADLAISILDKKKNSMLSIASHIDRAIIFSLTRDVAKAQAELDTYVRKNARMRDPNNNGDSIMNSIKRQYIRIAEKTGLELSFPELNGEHCIAFYLPMKGKDPVNDERRARSKLELFLSNLEKKGAGYMCHYGSRIKPGMSRTCFFTHNPSQVISYIEDRKDKVILPMQIILDDIL